MWDQSSEPLETQTQYAANRDTDEIFVGSKHASVPACAPSFTSVLSQLVTYLTRTIRRTAGSFWLPLRSKSRPSKKETVSLERQRLRTKLPGRERAKKGVAPRLRVPYFFFAVNPWRVTWCVFGTKSEDQAWLGSAEATPLRVKVPTVLASKRWLEKPGVLTVLSALTTYRRHRGNQLGHPPREFLDPMKNRST